MRVGVLFAGMFKRRLKYFLRYQFDTLSGLAALFIVFLILFYGAQALVGPGAEAGGTLDAIVVGYMVWMLGIFAYGETSRVATEESTAGTLEQLAMSPFGLRMVLVAEFIGGLVVQLVLISFMTLLMMASSGRWLNIDIFSIVPLVVLTLIGVWGMGLMLGGVAVVFKRTQGFLQIVQFLMVILVAAPLDRLPAFKYLPLAFGRELIHRVMVDGQSIFTIPVADTLFLVVHTAAWLAAGLVVFGRFEHMARERALLGHY